MNNIPIFLASDDNYAPYLCMTMYSILENTSSFIEFYILENGISDDTKNKIEKSINNFENYSIKYFDMSKFSLDRFPNVKHYSLNAFSRYFIPELVPNLDKILYLDVDIVVKGNISELYNQDLGNFAVGAILEDFYKGNYTTLKEKIYPDYKGGKNYFNTGVLLLDIRKFIKNDYPTKLVDLTIELFDKLHCPDQDIFNIIFENNFKILDYQYNYMPDHYKFYRKHIGKQAAEDLKNRAKIIHYTARKPWHKLSCADDDFWNIVNKTYFKEDLLNKLKAFNKKNMFNFSILKKRIFK